VNYFVFSTEERKVWNDMRVSINDLGGLFKKCTKYFMQQYTVDLFI